MEAMNAELKANYNQMEAMNRELIANNVEIERINSELRSSQQQLWAVNEELLKSQVELLLVNEKLKENEERLELALWAAREGMWDLDVVSGMYHINEQGADMLGYSPNEYSLSMDFVSNLLHPDDRRQTLKEFKDHISGISEAYAAEYRLKLPDGRWLWLWAKGRAVQRDAEGKATRILGLFRDISERKHLEENLQNSRQRYQELFEQSPVGLIKCNASGLIQEVNKNYLDLFRFSSRAELIRLNVFLTSNKALISLAEHLSRVFSTGMGVDVESQSMTTMGSSLWVHYKIHPVFENGKVTEAVVACEDITTRKHAEDKIRYLSYNDSLTGIHNRAYLDEAMLRLNHDKFMPLSIIMGDVNGLKLVNDAFGHSAGDAYLLDIATILKRCCRPGDVLARWGGDEFVILLPRTELETAENICEAIRRQCQLAEMDPIQPSIALGAQVKLNTEKNIYEALGEAEDTMYRNKLLETSSIRNSIISSLGATLHERTFETKEHTERLQVLSTSFGKKLGLVANDLDKLVLFAALHDIGKMGIPDDILSKAGPLNDEEWEIVKKHPEIGYRIVQASHELSAVAEEILTHHERWDGKGYPVGLSQEEIPFLARILAIVDAYDVMTNERPYKKAMNHDEAMYELKKCAGSQFEPDLVIKFIAMFDDNYEEGGLC